MKEQQTAHNLSRSIPKSSKWPKATKLDFLFPQCGTQNAECANPCKFRFSCSSAECGTWKSICLIFFILFPDFRFPHCGMRKSELSFFFAIFVFICFPFSALQKVGCRTSICFWVGTSNYFFGTTNFSLLFSSLENPCFKILNVRPKLFSGFVQVPLIIWFNL